MAEAREQPSDSGRWAGTAAGPRGATLLGRFEQALGWTALALGLGLFAARLVRLDLSPFILDEPQFLAAARSQLEGAGPAMASPITGSTRIHYGPSVLWFYGAVQWLVGPSAPRAIAAMCALVTVAHVAFCACVAAAFSRGRAQRFVVLFGVISLLVASSPYQHFWSRLAWDQLTNVVAFGSVALLAGASLSPWRCAGLGLLLGYGLSSHPMIAPLVAIVFAAIVVEHWRAWRRAFGSAVTFLVPAVAVNVPWLMALSREGLAGAAPGAERFGLVQRALETLRPATAWKIDYFFDESFRDFLTFATAPVQSIGLAGLWLLGLATAGGLLLGAGGRTPPRGRRLVRVAAASAVAFPLFFWWRRVGLEPHYQFVTGFVACVGSAALLASDVLRPGARVFGVGVLVALGVAQSAIVIDWRRYVAERGGTRGIHQASPIGAQVAVIDASCRSARSADVWIENRTRLFPAALLYHAAVVPACAGKRVRVCGGDQCPPTGERVVLEYARAVGGALVSSPWRAPNQALSGTSR